MSTAFDHSLERIRAIFSEQIESKSEMPLKMEDLKRKLIDSVPDCVSLHRNNGDMIFVSDRSSVIFGNPAENIISTGFLDHVHVQDRVGLLKAISDCAATDKPTTATFRLHPNTICDDSETKGRWREMTCRRYEDDTLTTEGDIAGQPYVIGVTRDISRRKQLEEQLLAEREQAECSSIAKGRFLANMSHELRTPLNAILGFSEMLKSEIMDNMQEEKKREYAGHIYDSADHLLNVLNDILDMSKIEAGKYEIWSEPFDLAEALENSVSITTGQALAKEVVLKTDIATDLPEICADKRALKQIMINLISNAIKFSDPESTVKISAERIARRVEIHVADSGIGISQEHLERLGEPFYQADSKYARKYEGTGLGLSVVKGLIDLHGGSLKIRSKKDVGTTVTVSLPLVAKNAGPVPANEEAGIVHIHSAGSRDDKLPLTAARQ